MAIVTKGYVAAARHWNDLLWPVSTKVIPLIREKGFKNFPMSEKGEVSPFEYAYRMEFFEYMRHDAEQKEAFDDYMGMCREVKQGEWFETYPAAIELASKKLRIGQDEVLIVDVGGGKGHETSKCHERFPNLRGRLVLQDLPKTIRGMENVLCGIEAMSHDFFDPQPVKGARIYYFRAVMHDWPDGECRRILRRTIEAMDPEYSRILIDEFVMPEIGADQRSANLDVLMMLYVSGTERSLPYWQELLGSVGLDIVKVWEPKGRRESVIECKAKSK